MVAEQAYGTPEEAAVASFSAEARPMVMAVRWEQPEEVAVVHVLLAPDYDYNVWVLRTPRGWIEVHGSI